MDMLNQLVDVLRDGEAYATIAVFIIVWWRSDHYARRMAIENRNFAVEMIKNNVESRHTLEALSKGLGQLVERIYESEQKIDQLKQKIEDMKGDE